MTTPPVLPSWHKKYLTFGQRLVVILAEGLGALVGLIVLCVCIFGIRIAAAPLELNFLTPGLTAMLSKTIAPYSVSATGTVIRWRGLHATLDLGAENTRIDGPDGKEIANIPAVAVSLDIRRLLRGKLAPTEIIVSNAKIRLVIEQDGSIGIIRGDAPPANAEIIPEAGSGQSTLEMIRSAFESVSPNNDFARLTQLSLTVDEITLDDLRSGKHWRAMQGGIKLRRVKDGVDAAVALQLDLATPIPFSGTAHLDRTARTVAGLVKWDNLSPADFQDFAPQLAAAQLPIKGAIGGLFDLGVLQPRSVTLEAHLGQGSITDPHFANGRLSIVSGDINAFYDVTRAQLDISRFALDLGGPTILANAGASSVGWPIVLGQAPSRPIAATGSVEVHDLPLARFNEFWPTGVAGDVRKWINSSLSVGSVDKFTTEAAVTYDPAAKTPLSVGKLDGTMTLRNVTMDYLPGLPKMVEVNATTVFTPDQFTFTVQSAQLGPLTIPNGLVAIDQFDQRYQRITIDAGIRGKAGDVMKVLNVPRLGYATAMGLDPNQIGGTLDGTLHFQFPLKNNLPFSEVNYGAKAQLSNLSLPKAALDRDLTDGNLDLTLDPDKVVLVGSAKLGDIPETMSWMQRLSGTNGPESHVSIRTRLDDAGRQKLGVDPVPDLLHGPADVQADYEVLDKQNATARIKLGLNDSDLTVDWADWEKKPGVPASSEFTLVLRNGKVTAVNDLHVKAEDLEATGSLNIVGTALSHANIDHLVQGVTDIAGTVDHPDGAPWQIKLRGPVLDAGRILKKASAQSQTDPSDPGPNLALDVVTDRLILGDNRWIDKASFNGGFAEHRMGFLMLKGAIGKSGSLDAELAPVASGGRIFVETNDLGALFHVAGITDDVAGGRVTITGSSKLEGDARRFTARVEGKDYRVLHMSFVTRLLSLASFSSVASMVTGQGIPFTDLKADLVLKDGLLTVSRARAYGGAIGVNVDGWFNLKDATLSLDGTLVPAYMLNNLIGNVPIIGNLLTGGEGNGIFSVNIRVGGKLAEPEISVVNPLSSLAPGFLRNLFLFDQPPAAPDAPPK